MEIYRWGCCLMTRAFLGPCGPFPWHGPRWQLRPSFDHHISDKVLSGQASQRHPAIVIEHFLTLGNGVR